MVVTVGFFDGVHLGHRRVLKALLDTGKPVAVVTFWPHPRMVLGQDASSLSLLSTYEEKCAQIKSVGISDIRCLDFNSDLYSFTAEEFIRKYLVAGMGCDTLVLGYDNRFGSDGRSPKEIAELCRDIGLETVIVPPYMVGDVCVSSTVIRQCISCGEMETVTAMLGARYSIGGTVVPGNRLGRVLGFPTANIRPSSPLKAIPADGVYATAITVGGVKYRSMTNIGIRPTFSDSGRRCIETNIFDFDEDIYGQEVELHFVAKIRNEKKFGSPEDLARQLAIDKCRCYGYN